MAEASGDPTTGEAAGDEAYNSAHSEIESSSSSQDASPASPGGSAEGQIPDTAQVAPQSDEVGPSGESMAMEPPDSDKLCELNSIELRPWRKSLSVNQLLGEDGASMSLHQFAELTSAQLQEYPALFKQLDKDICKIFSMMDVMEKRVARMESALEKERKGVADHATGLEQRLREVEGFIKGIPAWKQTIADKMEKSQKGGSQKIDEIRKEMEEQKSSFTNTAQQIESQLSALEEMAVISSNVSAKHGDSIDELTRLHDKEAKEQQAELGRLSHGLGTANDTLVKHAAMIGDATASASTANERCNALGDQMQTVHQILDVQVEGLQKLSASVEPMHTQISTLQAQGDEQRREDAKTKGRVSALESGNFEERIQDLSNTTMHQEDELKGLQERVAKLKLDTDKAVDTLEIKIAKGPPNLWKIEADAEAATAAIAEHRKSLASLQEQVQESQKALESAQTQLYDTNTKLDEQRKENLELRIHVSDEVQNAINFVDTKLDGVVDEAQLLEVNEKVDELRKQMLQAIEESQQTLKFELLHEDSPTVTNLKQFLEEHRQRVERIQARLEVVDETLLSQAVRHDHLHGRLRHLSSSLPLPEASGKAGAAAGAPATPAVAEVPPPAAKAADEPAASNAGGDGVGQGADAEPAAGGEARSEGTAEGSRQMQDGPAAAPRDVHGLVGDLVREVASGLGDASLEVEQRLQLGDAVDHLLQASTRHRRLLSCVGATVRAHIGAAENGMVDELAAFAMLLDVRLALCEAAVHAQRDQIAAAFTNLKNIFDYAGKLHKAMEKKASVKSLHSLELQARTLSPPRGFEALEVLPSPPLQRSRTSHGRLLPSSQLQSSRGVEGLFGSRSVKAPSHAPIHAVTPGPNAFMPLTKMPPPQYLKALRDIESEQQRTHLAKAELEHHKASSHSLA